jgi:hypothetical protein
MFIEIQVRAELVQRIMRNRFLAQAICIPDLPTPIEIVVLGGQKVVDHLEFGQVTVTRVPSEIDIRFDNGIKTAVPGGHRVRLTQPVKVFIATHVQIVQGGLKGPQNFAQIVDVDLYFDLIGDLEEIEVNGESQVINAAIMLTYTGNSLPPGALPADVQLALDAVLQQVELRTPLDLDPLEEALKSEVRPANVGVALSEDDTIIAIRVELSPIEGDPISAWQGFYGVVPDRLMGRDWSVLIDEEIITSAARNRFVANVAGSADFELTSGPNVSWQPAFGGLMIYFEGDALNQCDFNDIEAEVSAHTTFSLEPGSPPRLLTKTHAVWDLVDSDVLLCSVTAALFGAHLGAVLGGAGGAIGAAVGAVIGIVAGIVGVAIFAGSIDASKLPAIKEPGCEQTSSEDADYVDLVCRADLNPVQSGVLGSLSPDQLELTGLGLLLLGSADVPVREDQFTSGIAKFIGWDQTLNCNTKSVDALLQGSVVNSNAAGIGWQLCDVHVEQPIKFFYPSYSSASKIEIRIDPGLSEHYFEEPYPCHLYMRTSCGSRWFDLGTLKEPPEAPPLEEIILLWATHCSPAYNDYWGGQHHPEWLIDPDPPWEHTLHRWDVVATGLREGHTSVLADAEGRVVGSSVVNAAGHVRHSSVLMPSVSVGAVKLGQRASLAHATVAARGVPRGTPPDDGRLLITQTLLGQEAAVALNGRPRAVAVPQGPRSGLFVMVSSTGLHIYDLSRASVRGARLILQWRDPGLRGVAALPDGLLLAGDGGAIYVPWMAAGRLGRARTILATRALAATALRGVGCVLDERGVHVLDSLMRPRPVLPVEGADTIGTLAGHLAVRQRDGRRLALFELHRDDDATLRAQGSIDLPDGVTYRGDALVGTLEAPDSVTLPGGATVPVQRDPWLAASWRFPGHFVHVDAVRGRATVFTVGERRQMWKQRYPAARHIP